MKESISLSPKTRFLANKPAASAHSDLMASPAFQQAAATALLNYQLKLSGGTPEALAVVAAKLRGAQEFINELLNLGFESVPSNHSVESGLVTPEQSLNRPYEAPKK